MARTLKQHLDPTQGPKRILALDGGGVKGILTLGMLDTLETELRRRARNPDLVLSDYYDLIGGTSTGAIIASGLALGLPVKAMIELYLDLGPKVFGRTVGDGGLFRAKFDQKKLRTALEGVLGRRTLGTADLKTGFALCAKRIDTGSAWVLSNNPNAKFYESDPDSGTVANKKYRLVDIVQASAAAPTFFDEVAINISYFDTEADAKPKVSEVGYFVDGAVSANNNPSMQLLMLALVHEYGFQWKSGVGSLMMTSFGTGLRRPRIDGRSFQGKPPGLRGIHALRSMIYDTQVQGVMLMQAVSDPLRPWYVNSEIEGMQKSMITDQRMLDYQRIDVRLDPARGEGAGRAAMVYAEDVLGAPLAVQELQDMDELANGKPENMRRLLDLGRRTGPYFIGADYPNPFFDLKEWTVS
jgi:hypothetical protein